MEKFRDELLGIDDMINSDPEVLIKNLENIIGTPVPITIDTPDELKEAAKLLGQFTNGYCYLKAAHMRFVLLTKQAKKTDKNLYEDMMLKRDALQTACDVMKQKYASVSRTASLTKEANDELRMLAKI